MIRSPNASLWAPLIDDLGVRAKEVRGNDSEVVPMATTLQVVVVVEETSQQASDTVDSESEMQISTAAAQRDSTKKTALAVVATAAVDLANLFFLLRDDADTDTERRSWGRWTGGISVLFAFAALLSTASLVLALHTTVGVSAARRQVILVASAAALFVASAGTLFVAR